MRDEMKARILNNPFIDNVRIHMQVNENDYEQLRESLTLFSKHAKSQSHIDKELALVLYSMPQIIRNIYLSFKEHNIQNLEFENQLEDIWMELDRLVIECLS